MSRYSPQEELAPRDIVSRAVVAELHRSGAGPIFLDMTHLGSGFCEKRFPRIYRTCLDYGVDLDKQPVPVHPAAHYAMGGVRTDLHGRTSLDGLFAAGETACTGVHGANRLASNSLLEGLVFGARAGAAMRERAGFAQQQTKEREPGGQPVPLPGNAVFELRRLAWRRAGIERFAESLRAGLDELEKLAPTFGLGAARNSRHGFEADNLYVVISLIARCALARAESRGCHYRSDFPVPLPEFQKHSLVVIGGDVRFC